MTVRLTKNRIKELEVQLSIDDVLYEKFRRLNEDLKRREAALQRRKQIVAVYQRQGNIDLALQILEVHPTEQGTIVICR